MADVNLDDLRKALEAEGVVLDEEPLKRAWRRVTNAGGCEFCGQHVKVGMYVTPTGRPVKGDADPSRHKLVTACCRTEIK